MQKALKGPVENYDGVVTTDKDILDCSHVARKHWSLNLLSGGDGIQLLISILKDMLLKQAPSLCQQICKLSSLIRAEKAGAFIQSQRKECAPIKISLPIPAKLSSKSFKPDSSGKNQETSLESMG